MACLPDYDPTKQGLKRISGQNPDDYPELPDYDPTKQGLKLERLSTGDFTNPTSRLRSNKTRIETLKLLQQVELPLRLPDYDPTKQGLKQRS